MMLDEQLEDALEEALGVEEALRELRATLVHEPEPGGPVEARVADQLARRDPLLHEIGRLVLWHVVRGGTIVLEESAPEDPAVEPGPVDRPEHSPTRNAAVAAPSAGLGDTGEEDGLGARSGVPDSSLSDSEAGEAEADGLPDLPDSEPASPEALELLAGSIGPNWDRQAPGAAVLRLQPVIESLDRIGEPTPVGSPGRFSEQVRRVRDTARHLAHWASLEPGPQQELLALVVAKARYLQDEVDRPFAVQTDLELLGRAFKDFTRFSAQQRPGFVYGLSLKHRPTPKATWLDSARHWWRKLVERTGFEQAAGKPEETPEVHLDRLTRTLDRSPLPKTIRRAFETAIGGGVRADDPRLVRLAAPVASHLQGSSKLKALRKAVRDAGEVEPEDEEAVEAVPRDWPWMAATEGRICVVVGGVNKPEAAERIRDAFGFADVEWDSDAQGRKLEGTCERIRNGSVGMVVFLARYCSHRSQDALKGACKAGGAPFIRLESGYGVDGIRRQIEASVDLAGG